MQARKHTQLRVRTHTVWLSGEKLLFHKPGRVRSDRLCTTVFLNCSPILSLLSAVYPITASSLIFVSFSSLHGHLFTFSSLFFSLLVIWSVLFFSFYFLLTSLLGPLSWFLDQLSVIYFIYRLPLLCCNGAIGLLHELPCCSYFNCSFPSAVPAACPIICICLCNLH